MAYISATEVKAIREELKKEFPKYRFSVRKSSGGLAVSVSLTKGPKGLMETVGEKYTGSGYQSINHYHTNMYGEYKGMFDKILTTIKSAPAKVGRGWYDNSDAMTDYFDTAFYIHMEVGRYGKGYTTV